MENIEKSWGELIEKLSAQSGEEFNADLIFLTIGIEKIGIHLQSKFSKEEKIDIMHVGISEIFVSNDYYIQEFIDKDGWPHYTKINDFPTIENKEMKKLFMKSMIINFFQKRENINYSDMITNPS